MGTLIVMLSTYNGEKYLDKQLKSIYSQKTDLKIKLLVRDDGSKDRTLDILRKWKQNHDLELVEDGISLGAAKSFWKLIHMVDEADYYAFVDQDDIWDLNKIQCAVTEIGKEESPVLWFSNCRLIDENDRTIKERLKEKNQVPRLTVVSQLVCGSSQGCAMVFNNTVLNTIRKYSITEIPMHDLVVMMYCIVLGRVIYHDEPLFSYRVHGNNVVAKQGKSFTAKIKASYKQWFVVNKNAYRRFCIELLRNLGDKLDEQTKEYLSKLVQSKKSMSSRLSIIRNPQTYHYDRRTLRSFKLRVLLGII